jgi:hypothetical protein
MRQECAGDNFEFGPTTVIRVRLWVQKYIAFGIREGYVNPIFRALCRLHDRETLHVCGQPVYCVSVGGRILTVDKERKILESVENMYVR